MKKAIKSTYKTFGLLILSASVLTACDNGYSMGGRAGSGALIGAGTGAAIGALAGGGRGAAIGALSGGALGAGIGAATTPNRPYRNYNNNYDHYGNDNYNNNYDHYNNYNHDDRYSR